MKLSFGERLSYALGDFSNNGAYMFVGTFLITFLTIGMGLSGKVAGAIIMCVTIFDAINDVIIGSIVDKAHGRGVKYTTFLRFAILPMAVLMVLLFFSPNFSTGAKIAYSVIIYAIYTVAQTTFQVPWSNDRQQRGAHHAGRLSRLGFQPGRFSHQHLLLRADPALWRR